MKSQTRAWILALTLTLFWSTPVAAPFRYFATMLSSIASWLVGSFKLAPALATFVTYLLLLAVLVLLLLLDRSRNRVYLAGYIALAEVIYHLWIAFRTDKIYDVPLPISLGLALALLVMLFPRNTPGTWLSDAYLMAIPAWLWVQAALTAAFAQFDWSPNLLAPILRVPEQAAIFGLNDWLGLPTLAWAIIVLILSVLPLIWLTPGRARG